MAEEQLCAHCGAPRQAGYAACKYCLTPFPAASNGGSAGSVGGGLPSSIPCPQCKTLNEPTAQRCVECKAWVVVQCVFCHAISPYNVPACLKCGEAFAGAPQRLAERQRQQHVEQGLHVAGAVGNVAASFLGAAAGAGLFSHHEHDDRRYEQGYAGPGYGPAAGYRPAAPGDWGTGAGIAAGVAGGIAGAGIAQQRGEPGFFDSLFGGGSSDDGGGTGAGIAQSNDSGGGGILDSIFGGGGGSDDGGDDSGGSFGDDD
jgi:hypothetical protein